MKVTKNRVLAVIDEVQEEEVTSTGLILARDKKKDLLDTKTARVLDSNVEGIHKGDTVIFSRLAGNIVRRSGKDYIVLDEKDILVILDGGNHE
jgi:co-chaperonin GroES (HSP10)